MREEKMTIDGIDVYFDTGVRELESAAYPYCRIRGRRLTEEQSIEVIRHRDHLLKGKETELVSYSNDRRMINLDMD